MLNWQKKNYLNLISGSSRDDTNVTKNNQRHSFKSVINHLWKETVKSYSSKHVVKWSIWVIISTCCNYQVGNYIQPLWEEIRPSTNTSSKLNGANRTFFNDIYSRYLYIRLRFDITFTIYLHHSLCSFQYFQFYVLDLDSNENEGDIEIYNGYIESGTALLGALAVFSIGFVQVNWSKFGDLCIVIVSLLSGIILFFMSGTEYIWFGYIGKKISELP